MNDFQNEIQTLIDTLIDNPLELVSCIILGLGLLYTFVSKKFILIRLFLGDISFVKQRIIGFIFTIIGGLLLAYSTGILN